MDSHIDNADVVTSLRGLINADVLPHIILYGPCGIGKTHLVHLFIQEYFAKYGVPPMKQRNLVLAVPSSDDRGIKFVRTQVRDFVRGAHSATGPSRIVFMDDCDTLPVLSQQALRRIMEQHETHTTFIFVANRINVFIDPIQSRCVILKMAPVNIVPHASRLAKELGCRIGTVALLRLVQYSIGNLRQFIQYLRVLSLVLGDQEASEGDIAALCDIPPLGEIQRLLGAFLEKDEATIIEVCCELWKRGFPLQDILNYMQTVSAVYGNYENEEMLRITECVGAGTILCIGNRIQLLDIIGLFSGAIKITA